jgi:hypothetical protein
MRVASWTSTIGVNGLVVCHYDSQLAELHASHDAQLISLMNCTYLVKVLHQLWFLHHHNQQDMILLMVNHQQSEPAGNNKQNEIKFF